jgi:sporulation protein YlmC with PRC-barrel domain
LLNKSKDHFYNTNKIEELNNKRILLRSSTEDYPGKPILHNDYTMSKIFGWPNIWSIADDVIDEDGLLASHDYKPKLRSISEVQGYKVESGKKYIGYISDFVIETSEWKIKSFHIIKSKFLPSVNKEIIDACSIKLEINYPNAVIN